MEDLVRICKVCKCVALQKSVEKEINHQRFANYKSLREADDSQKRFILQGSSLPWQDGLYASLRRLLRLTLANSIKQNRKCEHSVNGRISRKFDSPEKINNGGHTIGTKSETSQEEIWADDDQDAERWEASSNSCSVNLQEFEEDHADVCFLVAGEKFRCHRAILAARSEYFKARFFRAPERFGKSGSLISDNKVGVLPTLEERDLSAGAFRKLLEYIYTDSVEEIDPGEAEEMFDAASRYLLFPLKRAVVDVLLPHLERTPPAELCNWLLMADMYEVSKLREHCLDAMALNFELFAATPEFRQMVKTLPLPSGDDAARTSAPSAPGEARRDNQGNLLDDLREKWLAIEGDELDQRDESAREFDNRLEELVALATLEESENYSIKTLA